MKHSSISLDLIENMLASPADRLEPDDEGHIHLLHALKRAVRGELTDRQRECVELFYGQKIHEKEIAARLGVKPPTVCKHLKKARMRLGRVLGYYL